MLQTLQGHSPCQYSRQVWCCPFGDVCDLWNKFDINLSVTSVIFKTKSRSPWLVSMIQPYKLIAVFQYCTGTFSISTSQMSLMLPFLWHMWPLKLGQCHFGLLAWYSPSSYKYFTILKSSIIDGFGVKLFYVAEMY